MNRRESFERRRSSPNIIENDTDSTSSTSACGPTAAQHTCSSNHGSSCMDSTEDITAIDSESFEKFVDSFLTEEKGGSVCRSESSSLPPAIGNDSIFRKGRSYSKEYKYIESNLPDRISTSHHPTFASKGIQVQEARTSFPHQGKKRRPNANGVLSTSAKERKEGGIIRMPVCWLLESQQLAVENTAVPSSSTQHSLPLHFLPVDFSSSGGKKLHSNHHDKPRVENKDTSTSSTAMISSDGVAINTSGAKDLKAVASFLLQGERRPA